MRKACILPGATFVKQFFVFIFSFQALVVFKVRFIIHFCASQVEANVRRVKAEVTAKCEALKSCITAYEVATHARLDTAVLFARARAEAFEHVTQRGEAVIANLTLVR